MEDKKETEKIEKENFESDAHKVHTEHKVHVHQDHHEIKHKIKKKLQNAKRDKIILGSLAVIFLALFIMTLVEKSTSPVCDNLDCKIDELTNYANSLTMTDAKSAVNVAISSLESAREIIDGDVTNESNVNTENTVTGNTVTGNTANTESTGTDVLSATLISDVRCTKCTENIVSLKSSLNQLFPGLNLKVYDYVDVEAKELMAETELTLLPIILFDSAIESTSSYATVQNYLVPVGDYLSLRIGADFDPTAEICDNGIDDTGDGLIDCDDAFCANTLTCNPNAIADCVANYDIAEDTVIFYYSNSCSWCAKMKPGVQYLEDQGYSVKRVEGSDPLDAELVSTCLAQHFEDGGVPKFICPKTSIVRTGAFADADKNLDQAQMTAFFDACKAE